MAFNRSSMEIPNGFLVKYDGMICSYVRRLHSTTSLCIIQDFSGHTKVVDTSSITPVKSSFVRNRGMVGLLDKE